MSKLIDNIKRLAGMVKNETKSGGNTAVRIGGLFEEIAAELEEKYDKTESDKQASEHNTNAEAHKNIQERIDTVLNDLNRDKLDKMGDGSDVSVVFDKAVERGNVSSGEKLSALWGKVCRWFADLKAVAFSGKAADLTEDQTHRFFTDAERNKLNGIAENANRYIHPTSHPANIVEQDSTHRFVSDTEKTAWNSKAAGTHTHKASEVTEETNKRFLTDAERTKINNTYVKTETYTRGEIDTKDTAVLDAAKKYVMDRISDVISGSPAALDTLYEIANALNNDPAFATTIMALINGKADSVHKHTKSQITDFPTSMPASDVYSWAKQQNKPSYTAAEVGAAPSGHNHDTVYQPKGSYAAASHMHTKSQITDFPSTMPASDVYAWAKAASKPSYTPSEVGAAEAGHNHDSAYAAKSHTHTATQISDTATKVMMTAAERSKLAGIETTISNPQSVPANSNLNNYTTPGCFYCAPDSTAKTILNKPWDGSFNLLVLKTAGCIQIYTPYKVANQEAVFIRKYYNGWGSWFRLNATLYV